MELQAEIKKELKDGFTWGEQASNVFSSLTWLLGTWLWMTTVFLGAVTALIFLTWEPDIDVTFLELQSGFIYLVVVMGAVTAFVLLVFGLPKRLRNVFRDVAQHRMNRKIEIEREVQSKIHITESLLIKYDLITESDVEARKHSLQKDRLI